MGTKFNKNVGQKTLLGKTKFVLEVKDYIYLKPQVERSGESRVS